MESVTESERKKEIEKIIGELDGAFDQKNQERANELREKLNIEVGDSSISDIDLQLKYLRPRERTTPAQLSTASAVLNAILQRRRKSLGLSPY